MEEKYIAGKVSIIIPVYNVKEYLNDCIQSVVAQTYSNIEIIIVDDGSNDGSELLCDEWAAKDSRIRVFHKTNGGLSDARNYGLKRIRGEYVGFVDSDDYIASDMYESFVKAMDPEVDIVSCGRVTVFPKKFKKKQDVYVKAPQKMLMDNEQALKELLLVHYLSFSVCDKLFRSKAFENITFPVGKISEDLPTTYNLIKKSKFVVNIGQCKYFCNYREGSISRKSFEIKHMSYALFARDIFRDVCKCYPSLKKEGEALYIKNVVATINKIDQAPDGEAYEELKKRLIKFLKRMFIRALCNPYILREKKKEIWKIIRKINR